MKKQSSHVTGCWTGGGLGMSGAIAPLFVEIGLAESPGFYLQQNCETCLLKVPVMGEGFCHTQLLHDQKGTAIRQAPFLGQTHEK